MVKKERNRKYSLYISHLVDQTFIRGDVFKWGNLQTRQFGSLSFKGETFTRCTPSPSEYESEDVDTKAQTYKIPEFLRRC